MVSTTAPTAAAPPLLPPPTPFPFEPAEAPLEDDRA